MSHAPPGTTIATARPQQHSTHGPQPAQRRWVRVLAWLLATGACLAVFGLYSAPEFMRMMADQVWSCF